MRFLFCFFCGFSFGMGVTWYFGSGWLFFFLAIDLGNWRMV
jgi:hypothetical protein